MAAGLLASPSTSAKGSQHALLVLGTLVRVSQSYYETRALEETRASRSLRSAELDGDVDVVGGRAVEGPNSSVGLRRSAGVAPRVRAAGEQDGGREAVSIRRSRVDRRAGAALSREGELAPHDGAVVASSRESAGARGEIGDEVTQRVVENERIVAVNRAGRSVEDRAGGRLGEDGSTKATAVVEDDDVLLRADEGSEHKGEGGGELEGGEHCDQSSFI